LSYEGRGFRELQGERKMEKMRVVITDYIEPDLKWEEDQLKELGVGFSYDQLKFGSPEQIWNLARDADIVIVNMAKITADVIGGLERCKLIIRHGVGYDNVDIAAATRRNIAVSYMPDYCVAEVAEQTVMLIFACQRKLFMQNRILYDSATQGEWDFNSIYPVFSLSGKTLGIVGLGRIGAAVCRMMQGFHLRFLICDPYLSDARKKDLGIETISLDEVLKESDIITVHTPLNRETHHFIDEPQLKRMKRTAILVNTSRGGTVNLRALDKALREGWISHAGIDVYEEKEPPDPDFPLLHNERAICTPHLSWLSEEAGWGIRKKIVEDVRRFVQKQGPRHLINPEVKMRFE
jgi:D-3-phosphoglycerate dehydrogenase / 2-oxoglutarate reductase